MSSDEDDENKRLWVVDPSMFNPGPTPSLPERITRFLKSVGRTVIPPLFLTYPVALVVLGIAFGGFVFWVGLLASMILMGLLLSRWGYAARFEGWDYSLTRHLTGLTLAFLALAGIYLRLARYDFWFVPLIFSLVATGLLYFRGRGKH